VYIIPNIVPEPYHFRGAGAVAKIIHILGLKSVVSRIILTKLIRKWQKICVDPNIIAEPYRYHLSGAGTVITEVNHEFLFSFEQCCVGAVSFSRSREP
jgi:hypothetical protein